MTSRNAAMDAIATRLQAVAPTRVVTRSFMDFADRPAADIRAGVFTVLSHGFKHPSGATADEHGLLIVGQILLPENTDKTQLGQQVEQAEFALLDDIDALIKPPFPADIGGLALIDVKQSGQLEAPYGWIAAALKRQYVRDFPWA